MKKSLIRYVIPSIIIVASLVYLTFHWGMESSVILGLIYLGFSYQAGYICGVRLRERNDPARRTEGLLSTLVFNFISTYTLMWVGWNSFTGVWLSSVPLPLRLSIAISVICSAGLYAYKRNR